MEHTEKFQRISGTLKMRFSHNLHVSLVHSQNYYQLIGLTPNYWKRLINNFISQLMSSKDGVNYKELNI